MYKLFLLLSFLWVNNSVYAQLIPEKAEYQNLLKKLNTGWGRYNTRNLNAFILLPECLQISIDFKYQRHNNGEYLREVPATHGMFTNAYLRPYISAYDGSYTCSYLSWDKLDMVIETASIDDIFYCFITRISKPNYPFYAVIKAGMLWNKPGEIKFDNNEIDIKLPTRNFRLTTPNPVIFDPNVDVDVPYLVINADTMFAFTTGKKMNLIEIKSVIDTQREKYSQKMQKFANLTETAKAIETAINMNTIYEPHRNLLVSTVTRRWNAQRGGYVFFGWDNFFLGYLAALDNKEMSYSIVIEHLRDMTEEGFISNNSQGNGRKCWDRSQPPVGGMMVWEIYKKYKEKWFLEMTYPSLLKWNRWWTQKRLYKGMLCWGSHASINPFNDPRNNDLKAAMLETGIDDSPMYENVPFDKEKGVMLLHDAGLNAMYIRDCEVLANMANELGLKEDAKELMLRAETFRKEIVKLWDSKTGIFLNKLTETNEFVNRLSPTLFYPMMVLDKKKFDSKLMMQSHFRNPDEFGGEFILPSIARNDKDFPLQKYWKGSIWAPLNFLTYISLRNHYQGSSEYSKELSEKSLKMFTNEWVRKAYIGENYSGLDGSGDHLLLQSDHFYAWGALMAVMQFVEAGFMPEPEKNSIK